jgi:hypothetical protein
LKETQVEELKQEPIGSKNWNWKKIPPLPLSFDDVEGMAFRTK